MTRSLRFRTLGLTVLVSLVAAVPLQAQICSGTIVLNTQAKVDNFNCSRATTRVYVSGDDITNLNGLSELTYAEQGLSIQNNRSLQSLTGLNGLRSVGGELYIGFNRRLTDIGAFSDLTSARDIVISQNEALTSISGFAILRTVTGDLKIAGNAKLRTVGGFGSLESAGLLAVTGNAKLTSLVGLSELTAVSGALRIKSNGLLKACHPLLSLVEFVGPPHSPTFTGVGGAVEIQANGEGCRSKADVLSLTQDLTGTLLDGRRGNPVESTALEPMWISHLGQKVYYRGFPTNNFDVPFTMDVWSSVTLPSGDVVTRRNPKSITVAPGETPFFNGVVNFAEALPGGLYTITALIGVHSDGPVERVEFFVRKRGAPRMGAPSLSRAETIALAEASFFGEDDLVIEGDTASRPGPEANTGLEALPTETVLGPGYPNPFNPTATVPFTLSQDGDVRLAVYDLLGREVAVLAQGPYAAGAHTAVLDGRGLPSGTYLVRLSAAGAPAQTQRLTLVK